MEKTIYELELHESLVIDANVKSNRGSLTIILRVAGGWIYTSKMSSTAEQGIGLSESSVFVAYNDEFKPKIADDIPNV